METSLRAATFFEHISFIQINFYALDMGQNCEIMTSILANRWYCNAYGEVLLDNQNLIRTYLLLFTMLLWCWHSLLFEVFIMHYFLCKSANNNARKYPFITELFVNTQQCIHPPARKNWICRKPVLSFLWLYHIQCCNYVLFMGFYCHNTIHRIYIIYYSKFRFTWVTILLSLYNTQDLGFTIDCCYFKETIKQSQGEMKMIKIMCGVNIVLSPSYKQDLHYFIIIACVL